MPSRGRPREFERDVALAQAMDVFWQRGYQDASVAALTTAMGIRSPSLYAAFGSKADLFCEVAKAYEAGPGGAPYEALDKGATGRRSVEALLRGNAELFTRRAGPKGCLLTRAVATCSPDETEVAEYLQQSLKNRVAAVRARLQRASDENERLPGAERDLAEFFDSVIQGMAVRAIEGASRAALYRTVDLAMSVWPTDDEQLAE